MKTLKQRVLCAAWAAGLVAGAVPALAAAADWPQQQPVRLIVPFSAGGGSDAVGRLLAQHLSTRLGQAVVVENRPGAGGSIGATTVARAKPDGYTLLLGSGSEVVQYPAVYASARYDPVKDFAAISPIANVPLVLAMHRDAGADTVPALLALAKARPNALNYGSAGVGSSTHMAVALLASMTGTEMTHVPYKGSAPVVSDLVGGSLHLAMPTLSAVLPFRTDERLKLLAVSTGARSPMLPDVPTLAEAGVAGYDVGLWTGLFAPAGVSPEVIARLNQEVQAIVGDAGFRDALQAQGAVAQGGTSAAFAQQLADETAMWRTLVEQAGLRAE